jgi:hypothetical protein
MKNKSTPDLPLDRCIFLGRHRHGEQQRSGIGETGAISSANANPRP